MITITLLGVMHAVKVSYVPLGRLVKQLLQMLVLQQHYDVYGMMGLVNIERYSRFFCGNHQPKIFFEIPDMRQLAAAFIGGSGLQSVHVLNV